MRSSYDDIPTLGTSTQWQHTYSGQKSYDIVGYIHSDSGALCEEHAEYGGMPDPGNESGKVQAIFEGDETDSDILCDMCYTIAFSQGLHGTALRDACLIQGKNIWYARELKELALKHLEKEMIPATAELEHCFSYALSLLETSDTMPVWYAKMQELEDMDIPALFPEVVERYQDMYWQIREEVQDHIRSITEQ